MAYDIYLNSGQTYFHALTLYDINDEIISYLYGKMVRQEKVLTPTEQQLLILLIQWRNTFDYYENAWNSDYEDTFAFEKFEGALPFPADVLK